jgi:predicted heme/steroid binding protein
MKKFLFLSLLFTLALTSCSDDDNKTQGTANKGTLTVNGVDYDVNRAYLVPNYTGQNPEYDKRRFYIVLANDGLSLNNNEFVYLGGITQLIDFNLYTSDENPGSIEETTYGLWSNTPNTEAYIAHAGINTDVEIQNGEFISANSLSSDDMDNGQVAISKNNGVYNITFSFSNETNTVTGSYKGTLQSLNYNYE